MENYLVRIQRVEKYGHFTDCVFVDLIKVLRWISRDVKSMRRDTFTSLKEDVDFVYKRILSRSASREMRF